MQLWGLGRGRSLKENFWRRDSVEMILENNVNPHRKFQNEVCRIYRICVIPI